MLIIGTFVFVYYCISSQYYTIKLVPFALLILLFIPNIMNYLKIKLANRKFNGSSFCPSFFDLTYGDMYPDYVYYPSSTVNSLLTTDLSRIEATAYKNAFAIRTAGREYLQNRKYDHHEYVEHDYVRDHNQLFVSRPFGLNVHCFPSAKPILLDCGHIVCDECMMPYEWQPDRRQHGFQRDNCWNNFYRREFNYDHSKYLEMQRLCVDGYVRQSEHELDGYIVPSVVNGIIDHYMPQRRRWECYYEHGRYNNGNTREWGYVDQNAWE